jgi:hypothetical protein
VNDLRNLRPLSDDGFGAILDGSLSGWMKEGKSEVITAFSGAGFNSVSLLLPLESEEEKKVW